MNRKVLSIGILVAWVLSLGWLGAREWSRRGRSIVTGRQVVSPGAAYYRVTLGGAQVGFSLLQVDTLAATDTSPALVLLQHRIMLAAGDAPDQRRFEVSTSAWLTTDLRLWSSETVRNDSTGAVEWKTRVVGDSLRTLFIVGADSFRTALRLDTIPVPLEAVPLWLATYGAPRPGQATSLPIIDLATLARRKGTWTATAESTFTVPDSSVRLAPGQFRIVTTDTVRAWRFSGTDRSVQIHEWSDEQGFPIRRWTGGGLEMVRESFEVMLDGWQQVSDTVTGRSRLRIMGSPDAQQVRLAPRSASRRLLPGAEYPPLDASGPTQRVAADTFEMFDPTSWRGQQAFRPLEPLPMRNPRLLPELIDEPRLSPQDTAITQRARSLIGNSANAREVAMTIVRWVHTNIVLTEADPGRGARPAGAVLASESGTAEEAALLIVAMARRVGLPARLVGGMVVTTRGVRTHTWAELFIGDWIPVDPAQRDFTASAAHIRLVTGATGRWTDLLPLAGTLVGSGTDPRELR